MGICAHAGEDGLANGNADSSTERPVDVGKYKFSKQGEFTDRMRPKVAVLVAISLRGIAACKPMSGG